ncbi:unnamed protein product, partial [Discosporangium mesarthrocarpum]
GQAPLLVQQWLNLASLLHHRDSKDKQWLASVSAAAEVAMPLLPEWCRCGTDEAVELACKVNVNAHGLVDISCSNNILGVGMFPLVAMFNHSCRPNCTFVFQGGKMELRVIDEVSRGTELTLSYIDLIQSTQDRQAELLSTKDFLCRCARC